MRACECTRPIITWLALATSPVSSLATLRFPVSRPTMPCAPMLAAHQNTSSEMHGRVECKSGEHETTASYQADAPHARHLRSVRQHGTVHAPNVLTGDLARLEVSIGLYERLSAAPRFSGTESRLTEVQETMSEVEEVVPRMERSIMMEWCERFQTESPPLLPLLPPPPPLLPPLPPLSPPPPPPPPLDTLSGILVDICLLGLCATMIRSMFYAIRRMIYAFADDSAMDLNLADTTNQAQAGAAQAQMDAIQSYATHLSLARDTA